MVCVCVHVSVSNKSIFAYICVSQCGEIEFNVIMKLEHCIVVYFLSLSCSSAVER